MLNLIHGTDLIVLSSHAFGSTEVRTSEIMSHLALGRRVFFFNEPIIGKTKKATVYYIKESDKVTVVQPYLPEDNQDLISLVKEFIHDEHIHHLTIWTDTPEGLKFIKGLPHDVAVYDKVRGALVSLRLEQEIIIEADVILNTCTNIETLHQDVDLLNFDHAEHKYINDVVIQKPQIELPKRYAIQQYQSFLG